MCFAGRVPQLCFPSVPSGVWPASELICVPAVFPSYVVQSSSPTVFPTSGQMCIANRGFSQIVVCPTLPQVFPQLYPKLLFHLDVQLCFPACSHINFRLVSTDFFQIVCPILFFPNGVSNLITVCCQKNKSFA